MNNSLSTRTCFTTITVKLRALQITVRLLEAFGSSSSTSKIIRTLLAIDYFWSWTPLSRRGGGIPHTSFDSPLHSRLEVLQTCYADWMYSSLCVFYGCNNIWAGISSFWRCYRKYRNWLKVTIMSWFHNEKNLDQSGASSLHNIWEKTGFHWPFPYKDRIWK